MMCDLAQALGFFPGGCACLAFSSLASFSLSIRRL
jgi:hypothetical protein